MLFIEPTLLLCRHNAGTVFIRPISASHSRTDCWRLPVCELRRFLHRNNPVCCEYCGVCVPAAASPQQDNRANGMKPPRKTSFHLHSVHKLIEEMEINVQVLEINLFRSCTYLKFSFTEEVKSFQFCINPDSGLCRLICAGSSGPNH